jgi:RNA polymerase sigma-70 factor, ECF subfamily
MASSGDAERPGRVARLSALVDASADIVRKYLVNRHRAGDLLDTDDLVAEVFGIAWQRLDDIPGNAETAWLITVARNRLMNMRSKQSRRQHTWASQAKAPAEAPAAEDEAIARVTLQAGIDALTSTEREIFTLSVWEGLSTHEISQVLGITENTARVRLSRAKSTLRAHLRRQSETKSAFAKDTD